MTLLAVIAMVCGPMTGPKAHACYKQMILCVEHKMLFDPNLREEDGVRECILEK